jgi:hypothetical protein
MSEETCPQWCRALRAVHLRRLHPGTACSGDAECPGAECGPALFELRDRLAGDVGPVVVGADLAVQQLVPLEGLIDTPDLFAFVVPEALNPGQDLNGDGDEHDEVMMLVDRHSGHLQRTGATKPDCPADGEEGEGCREIGRAVVRVREPPFSYPAVAADGDEVAVFETEPGDALDANLDLDLSDTVLRVFRLGTGELTQGIAITSVDSVPLVNGRSLAISTARCSSVTAGERQISIASGGIFILQANGGEPRGQRWPGDLGGRRGHRVPEPGGQLPASRRAATGTRSPTCSSISDELRACERHPDGRAARGASRWRSRPTAASSLPERRRRSVDDGNQLGTSSCVIAAR